MPLGSDDLASVSDIARTVLRVGRASRQLHAATFRSRVSRCASTRCGCGLAAAGHSPHLPVFLSVGGGVGRGSTASVGFVAHTDFRSIRHRREARASALRARGGRCAFPRCFNGVAAAGWRCRIGVGPVFGIGGAFASVVESCSLSYRVRVSTHLGLTRRSTGRAGTQCLSREHRRGPPVS
jgi:hypothetical protein